MGLPWKPNQLKLATCTCAHGHTCNTPEEAQQKLEEAERFMIKNYFYGDPDLEEFNSLDFIPLTENGQNETT